MHDYVRVVRRHWRLVLASLLAVVAVAELVTFRMTPEYQSHARIFVSNTSQSASDAMQGSNFATQRVSSYAALVNGREMAVRVVDKLNLDESADTLSKHISATVIPATVIVEITATDRDPKLAQRIGQATAEELQTFVSDLETPTGKSTAPVKATIIDPSDLPHRAVSPQPLRNLGLGVLVGLALGLGLAFAREFLVVGLRRREDVAQVGDVPVLGGVLYDASADAPPRRGSSAVRRRHAGLPHDADQPEARER